MIRIEGNKQTLKNMPPHAMSSIGINQIAYIVTSQREGDTTYTVYAADGSEIVVAETMDEAQETIRTQNLHQVTVH